MPALILDNGEMITENVAVLDWIADQYPALGVPGPRGRTRQIEALAFIATELHLAFKPFWHDGTEDEKAKARAKLEDRFRFFGGTLAGCYLFGDALSAADCYLFVILLWTERFGIAVPEHITRLRRRMEQRPSVAAAWKSEGWAPRKRSSALVGGNPDQHRSERPLNDTANPEYAEIVVE